jgi:hypothetical protein
MVIARSAQRDEAISATQADASEARLPRFVRNDIFVDPLHNKA